MQSGFDIDSYTFLRRKYILFCCAYCGFRNNHTLINCSGEHILLDIYIEEYRFTKILLAIYNRDMWTYFHFDI